MKEYTLITLMGMSDTDVLTLLHGKKFNKDNLSILLNKSIDNVNKSKSKEEKKIKGFGPLMNILTTKFEHNENYRIKELILIKELKLFNKKEGYNYKRSFNNLEKACKELDIKFKNIEFGEDKNIVDYNDIFDILQQIFDKFNLENVLINFASGTGQWKTVAFMFLDKSKNIFMIDVKHKEKQIIIETESKFEKLINYLKERILKYNFDYESFDSRLVFEGIEKEKKKIDFYIRMIKNYFETLEEKKDDNFFHYPLLITGETGTGKSEIVEYIEKKLNAKNNFVKFNIAGLSENIIESELFGHKKGAFTDAKEERSGLIEKANNGVLFLDEIGELSKQMQVKLLRVLQDGKYKKVGDNEEKISNFVLIVATNKNLIDAVNNNEFREDLYWRINRVIINLPPIMKRSNHRRIIENFILEELKNQNDFFQKMGYEISSNVDEDIIKEILNMKLTGNFRELQKLIREAVLSNILNRNLMKVELKIDDFNFVENDINKNEKDFDELIDDISEIMYQKYKVCVKDKNCSFKTEHKNVGNIINYSIIKKMMKKNNLNQKEVAEKLGINEKTVGEWKKMYKEFY